MLNIEVKLTQCQFNENTGFREEQDMIPTLMNDIICHLLYISVV